MEEYKRLQNEYVQDKKNNESPQEPPIKTLLIPANSSATSVYQVLNDNGGIGLMFETEGETLANTFKSDYGNFSDGFRKAFHHEMISCTRCKNREFSCKPNAIKLVWIAELQPKIKEFYYCPLNHNSPIATP